MSHDRPPLDVFIVKRNLHPPITLWETLTEADTLVLVSYHQPFFERESVYEEDAMKYIYTIKEIMFIVMNIIFYFDGT